MRGKLLSVYIIVYQNLTCEPILHIIKIKGLKYVKYISFLSLLGNAFKETLKVVSHLSIHYGN